MIELHIMNDKEIFITKMKAKTKKFAVDIIGFCNTLKSCKASFVITFNWLNQPLQLVPIIGRIENQDLKKNFSVKHALLGKKLMNLNTG